MPRIKEHGYGFFPGGDPRDFTPDSDSTPEEMENHRRACDAWDRGEQNSHPDCQHDDGVILTLCQFGLGSYTYEEQVGWVEWFRYGVMRDLGTWFWWRLPHSIQDWWLERKYRAARRSEEG